MGGPLEIAGALVKAAESNAETKGSIAKLLEPFCEGAAIVTEQLRVIRLGKEITLLKRAKAILEKEGISPAAVNFKILVPLLDNAALEDSDEMAERWASLLASAADSKGASGQEAAFVEILRQLSPMDARTLDIAYRELAKSYYASDGVSIHHLQETSGIDDQHFPLVADNLLRLRLLQLPSGNWHERAGVMATASLTHSAWLFPTHLGTAFTNACSKRAETD